MKGTSGFEVLMTADQLDDLLCIPLGTCQKYVDEGSSPDPQNQSSPPRWGRKGFIKWLRILSTHAVDEFGKPPLGNPHIVFQEHRGGQFDDAA